MKPPFHLVTISTFLVLLPLIARAEPAFDSMLFGMEPPAGDLSAKLIRELFMDEAGKDSALRDVLTEVNKLWFYACGAMIFFMISAGMIHSAADGEFFGKKHSAVFVPARMLIAGMMLVPGTDGISLVQKAVVTTAYYSIGAASKVWEQTVVSVAKGRPLTPPADPKAPDMVRVLLEGEICRHVMEGWINDPNNVAKAAGATNRVIWNGSLGSNSYIYSIDYQRNGQIVVPGICGRVVISAPSQRVDWVNSTLGDMKTVPELVIDQAAFNAQYQWIRENLNGAIRDVGSEVYSAIISQGDLAAPAKQRLSSAILRLNADYNSKLSDAISTAASLTRDRSSSAVIEAATNDGWSSAGAYFMMLARLNGQIASAATSRITAEDYLETNGRVSAAITSARESGRAANLIARIFGTAGAEDLLIYMTKVRDVTGSLTGQVADGVIREASLAGVRPSDVSFAKNMDPVSTSLFKSVLDGMANGGSNSASPFEAQINLGHNLVLAGEALMAGSAAATAAENFGLARGMGAAMKLTGALGFGSKSGGSTGAMTLMGAGLYAAGVVLAYIMPILPAIFWVVGVVGYLVLVLEAILATPLWMLGHMRLDGDGFAGPRGIAGYEIALSLIIRPVAMVIGLVVAIIIYHFGTVLLAKTLYPAVLAAAGGHYGGLTGVVVWSLLAAIVSTALTLVAFKESLGAADRITNWVSVRASGTAGSSTVSQAQQMTAILGYQALSRGVTNAATATEGRTLGAQATISKYSDKAASGAHGAEKKGGIEDGRGVAQDVSITKKDDVT